MHNIYNYNRTISTDKNDIFKAMEDDALILKSFSLLNSIEYHTAHQRNKGTLLQITLNIKGKLYRFKSKITDFNEPHEVTIETYTRYGIIFSQLKLIDISGDTMVNVKCEIDNSNFMTKTILKIMQPFLKVALNRSINKFLNSIQSIYY